MNLFMEQSGGTFRGTARVVHTDGTVLNGRVVDGGVTSRDVLFRIVWEDGRTPDSYQGMIDAAGHMYLTDFNGTNWSLRRIFNC